MAIPNVIQSRLILDTGATTTLIDESVLKSLGLTPTGTAQILTPSTGGTAITCPMYDVFLGINHPNHALSLGTIPVIGSDFTGQGIQGLVGCDVLKGCLLIYDGVSATFTLAF
ncbi:MAG TPA: retropepsin-like aspartic protease [Tepidisphaeraceae bacterium]|nr:retropepsin-like aspartic protease [Tepidisphaeraceae bacterium]